jgi:hypothetical protein
MDRAFQNRWSGDLVQDLVARMHPTIALAQQLLPLRYLYPFPHTTLSLQKAAALHALSLWIHQQCSRSSVTSVPPWPCTSRWVRRAAKRAGCTAQMARSSGGQAGEWPCLRWSSSLSMVSFSLQLKSNQVHEIIMCLMSPASIMIDQGTNACCFT